MGEEKKQMDCRNMRRFFLSENSLKVVEDEKQ